MSLYYFLVKAVNNPFLLWISANLGLLSKLELWLFELGIDINDLLWGEGFNSTAILGSCTEFNKGD